MKNKAITIIAEIGSVHDGSFGNAMKAVEVATACGADIVKFQTHIAEAETLRNAPMPAYFKGEPRLEYFRRTAFSPRQWREIATHCAELGVQPLRPQLRMVDRPRDGGHQLPLG